jgi:hypothetical protein
MFYYRGLFPNRSIFFYENRTDAKKPGFYEKSLVTNHTELKKYIYEHRNDKEAFQAALQVLVNRRNPANLQPYPFDLENPQTEVEALLTEKLNQGASKKYIIPNTTVHL